MASCCSDVQCKSKQEASKKLLRRTNHIFLISAVPFLLMALALAGSTALFRFTPFYIAFLIIGAFIIAFMSILSKIPLLLYTMGILAGVLCLLAIALWGFYNPNVIVINPTTLKPDKSFGSAISYSFLEPETLTTTQLFACGTMNGPACTRFQDTLGTALDYLVLAGGMVAGNILVRRKLRQGKRNKIIDKIGGNKQ